jgi:hypothetical protein
VQADLPPVVMLGQDHSGRQRGPFHYSQARRPAVHRRTRRGGLACVYLPHLACSGPGPRGQARRVMKRPSRLPHTPLTRPQNP